MKEEQQTNFRFRWINGKINRARVYFKTIDRTRKLRIRQPQKETQFNGSTYVIINQANILRALH